MKRILAAMAMLCWIAPARAQYLDGLPTTPAPTLGSIMGVCSNGTPGRPGTCTTTQTTIAGILSLGGTGTPAGADTQVQFNNLGAFGADPTLVFNSASKILGASFLTLGGAGTALNVTNNAAIGGTLGVTGVSTFGSTGNPLTITPGAASTTNALIINTGTGGMSVNPVGPLTFALTFSGTGGGTGATGTYTVSGSAVTSVALTAAGSNYNPTGALGFSDVNCTATGTYTITAGAVVSVTKTGSGSGCSAGGTLSFLGGGAGSGATGTYAVSGGAVTTVTLGAAGSGYTLSGALGFPTNGGGYGAAGTWSVSTSIGPVVAVAVTNGGAAYRGGFLTTSGTLTGLGAVTARDGFQYTGGTTTAQSNSIQPVFQSINTYNGNITSDPRGVTAFNMLSVDDLNITGTGGFNQMVLQVQANSGVNGSVGSIATLLTLNAAGANSGVAVGGTFDITVNAPWFGGVFGLNSAVNVSDGAGFQFGVSNEIDVGIGSGNTPTARFGLTIVSTPFSKTQGSLADSAISFSAVNLAGLIGFHNGLNFGNRASGGWPIDPTGTMLVAQVPTGNALPTVAWGMDFNEVTFTGGFLRGQGFSVDGNGAVQSQYALLSNIGSTETLDTGAKTLSAATVASGGTGATAAVVLYDAYGGVFQANASGGAVVGPLTILQSGWVQTGSVPSNPVPVDCYITGVGGKCSSVTLNETWATETTLGIGTVNATTLAIGNSGSTMNLIGAIQAGGTAAVSCPSGVTAGTVTVKNGIVTHC